MEPITGKPTLLNRGPSSIHAADAVASTAADAVASTAAAAVAVAHLSSLASSERAHLRYRLVASTRTHRLLAGSPHSLSFCSPLVESLRR